MAWLLGLAAVLAVAGLGGFRRRDLVSTADRTGYLRPGPCPDRFGRRQRLADKDGLERAGEVWGGLPTHPS